jgi:uncharacterized protein involved in exopolysaccharide biosynthesis
MTHHEAPSVGVRDVLRWWPLVVLPAVIAIAAALWSVSQQPSSYTATTKLMVHPLAQWDETFLGTSLLRDGGDAKITAATAASSLDSRRSAATAAASIGDGWTPEAIDSAVEVSAVPETNVVEVTAHSSDPKVAARLAEDYPKAVLAERWRTISTELDTRIAALSVTTAADPNAGEASTRLQTLTIIRQAGADPTLRIDSPGAAVEDKRLPATAMVALAAIGGAAVGLVCAMAAARLRRRPAAQPASALR